MKLAVGSAVDEKEKIWVDIDMDIVFGDFGRDSL